MPPRREGGYLLIDHSASPGLPEDLARAAGYDPAHTRGGRRFETATLTCSHCKSVVVPNQARTREREFCFKCMHYICDGCAYLATLPDYDHLPFDKRVELTLAEHLGTPSKLLLP